METPGGVGGGGRRKKRKREVDWKRGGDAEAIKLPGGHTTRVVSDEIKDEVTYRVRAYLDEVFGTIMLQVKESVRCFDAVPILVKNILAYNNVHFATVELYRTDVSIPEPLWFRYELDKRHLMLYLNEPMYNEYCTSGSPTPEVPVIWSNGHVLIDKYNPYRAHPDVSEMDDAKIKCAMVCDHVAQHILHRYYSDTPFVANTELHEGGWTRYGTTLHSMLDVEIVESPCRNQHGTATSQVLTMLPQFYRNGGIGLGMISSREYAL